MNLIVDIGSTSSKAALFFKGKEINTFKNITDGELRDLRNLINTQHCIVSSLGRSKEELTPILGEHLFLDKETKLPFSSNYKTPATLGADRLALAAAAIAQHPNKNVLVIDAGTCITYEFITAKSVYLGGSISPGFAIRLKSMHDYTNKLPLIEDYYSAGVDLIGDDTTSCMLNGVVNGVKAEVKGIINQYKQQYPDLITVICGGDSNLFESMPKEGIFVNSKFLFFGLNYILEYNVA